MASSASRARTAAALSVDNAVLSAPSCDSQRTSHIPAPQNGSFPVALLIVQPASPNKLVRKHPQLCHSTFSCVKEKNDNKKSCSYPAARDLLYLLRDAG